LTFFTDYIADATVQYKYGWYMISGITFVFIFNFSFIFREVIKIIGLLISRYYNRISKYTDKLFSTQKNIELNEKNDLKKRNDIFIKVLEK